MKKEIFVISLIVTIVFVVFYGLSDPFNNDKKPDDNDHEKVITTINVPLNMIALTLDDVYGNYNKTAEKHMTDPYTAENATGNGLSWNVIEHYQSLFTENKSNVVSAQNDPTNKITQSITKLESKEKAEYYVNLKKPSLMEKTGYSNLSIETIGSKSFYLTTKVTYDEDEYDYYVLCFSIGDVVVTIGGLANSQSTYVDYAKIIESNVINAVEN